MHNDNRKTNQSPNLRRSPLTIAIASLVGLGGMLFGTVGVLWHSDTLANLATGTVMARIPMQPSTMEDAVASWTAVDAVPASTSFIDATVTGLPTDVVNSFVTAEWAALIMAVLTVLPIIVACVLVLTGRLRWSFLAGMVGASGLVIMIGSVITAALAADAAVFAGSAVYADEQYWLEPGFLVGLDPLPVVAGFLVLLTALALARLSRFATDADGIV
ncbi:hypothetical protein [Cryobacterium sp. PH29-G1]|uniref:hypothetical protein n=1 Tax=Cryobacterium sp. PH29-G1 TaxID=3046211 RepID=UPI0024BAD285|nr:hypothetical protein [Cryobacterium sp. PH29-G1]MDJ0349140.1 hypothetical protein [Cryobacterium sp. PH29-G1]